jgi:hypothetical protein
MELKELRETEGLREAHQVDETVKQDESQKSDAPAELYDRNGSEVRPCATFEHGSPPSAPRSPSARL